MKSQSRGKIKREKLCIVLRKCVPRLQGLKVEKIKDKPCQVKARGVQERKIEVKKAIAIRLHYHIEILYGLLDYMPNHHQMLLTCSY